METVLVDTSVWINAFKGIETNASLFLKNSNDILVATCPPVVQEILQGIVSDKDHQNISEYLNNVINLPSNGYSYARQAANLYRSLRKKGITIRKPNDCLIAVYAMRNNIKILHDDKDFSNIAAFSDLKTVQV
jgi:predicted nucleic acid-binding protein